mgnify:FL=1
MPYTTVPQNNEKTEVNEPLHVTKLMQTDARLREMVRIWITLSPSQKEALMHEATRASRLNLAIEAFRGTEMGR